MTLKRFIDNGYEQYGLRDGDLRASGGRFEKLSTIPNPIRRAGAQAFDVGVFLGSKASVYLRTEKLRRAGISMIGQGYESVVYLNEPEGQVTKFALGSIRMTALERQREALRKQHEFDLVRERLGSFTLSQTISVGPYVLSPRRDIIQTSQSFVRFNPFLDPVQNTPNITFPSDAAPRTYDQLSNFIDRAWELEGRHCLLPDTNGPENVVTDMEGNIVLLDTQPIGLRHPKAQETIKTQLVTMSEILEKI